LTYALLTQAYEYPHPFGEYGIPFDRALLTVFSKRGMESQVRGGWEWESFWFTEMMTRLMRVNKQIYREVYNILYSEFALHLSCPFPVKPEEWLGWLKERNPRAIQVTAHLHIKAYIILLDENANACRRKRIGDIEDVVFAEYKTLAQGFPNLRSVRFQIEFSRDKAQTASLSVGCVERILRRAAAFGRIQVIVFPEPFPEESLLCQQSKQDIILACRKALKQSQVRKTWSY
jgi:hypothetical protein